MKKFLAIFFILVLCGNAISQERWILDQRMTPKPPLGKGVILPQVKVTWENPNTQPTYYFSPSGVTAVGANFRVLPNSNQQDEIYLSSNPAWPLLLYGASNSTAGSTYSQGVYVSTNGGLNWFGTDIMPNCPVGASDPAPAIDKFGNFVFTSLNTSGSVSMFGQYSTDHGVTWSSPYTISGGSPSDKNLTGSDDVPSSPYYGRTYTAWSYTSGTWHIRVSYTTNSGVSWSTAQQVNSPSTTSQGADVVVGPAGVVYVCWSKQSSVSTGVGLAKSTNGGVNWTSNETIFNSNGTRSSSYNGWGLRTNDFPRIACDKSGGPRNGWLYIVDDEVNLAPAGSDADVILHKSTDGGTTWSAGIRVNQDAVSNGKVQWFPCVCVDPTGGVNVLYYDNRNYPSVGDSCETYMSRSVDGGSTWTDIKVSDHRWKPAPEPGLGTYGGDYIGITSGNGKIWPFWFDNKSGSMQAWTAPIDLGPSISHTQLGSTEQTTGTIPVNCVITPSGSGINPSTAQLKYAKNSTTWTTVQLTNSSGTNWTANITLSGAGTYNYYLTATDSLVRTATAPAGAPANYYSFVASADTVKPVITHIPIGNTPKLSWPVSVSATVTDNIGVDSAWVNWKKGAVGVAKRFKLINTSGNVYEALFNSIQADVNAGDTIFYRIIAQDNSSGHNRDSTALYNFKIVSQATACIGTGTIAMGSASGPFNTYWYGNRTQFLYTSAEIIANQGAAGNITRIGFNISAVGGAAMTGFNINMQHTALSTLTGFTSTGWTNVYTGTYTVPATGWQYIDLQTPFAYNGTSNLMVEICFGNSSYTTATTVLGTTMSGMEYSEYHDISTACTTFNAPTSQTARANTCFVINTVTGTGSQVGSTVPSTYSLSQNYPNPFNPVTRINFAVPKQGFVNLKIYDVLGREVKTLVNEVKSPGAYSVDFNGSELSSGVYFYRMESNGFTDIKKMLMIK